MSSAIMLSHPVRIHLRKPQSKKDASVLLQLPTRLFAEVIAFCPKKKRCLLLTLSKKYESVLSDACIFALTKEKGLPDAYKFYREALCDIPPRDACRNDFFAIKKAIKKRMLEIKNFSLIDWIASGYPKGSERTELSRNVIRDALPDRSSFTIKPVILSMDFLGGKRLDDLIAYKIKENFYAACIIKRQRVYVIGENHEGDLDKEFQRHAQLASSSRLIEFFLEGAAEGREFFIKKQLKLPQKAALYGLEDQNLVSQFLQDWSVLTLQEHYHDSVGFCNLLKGLCLSEIGRGFLLKSAQAKYPEANKLAQWLLSTIDWKKGTFLSTETAFLQGVQQHVSHLPPLIHELGLAFKENRSLFTKEEFRVLAQYLASSNKLIASKLIAPQVVRIFIEKRERDFVTNFFKNFSFMQPGLLLIGGNHVRRVFRLLEQHAAKINLV